MKRLLKTALAIAAAGGGLLVSSTAFATVEYSTGFEGPEFTPTALNGQNGWSSRATNVATTAPATGAQHMAQTSLAAPTSTTNPLAISPQATVGTEQYAVIRANLRLSDGGSYWRFNPQAVAAGAVTTAFQFEPTAHKIQVTTWSGTSGSFVDTGATWTPDTYFAFKAIVQRSNNSLTVCKDGVAVYTNSTGNGTTGSNNIDNAAISQIAGSGQTAGQTFFVDDFAIEYTDDGTCGGVTPTQHTVSTSVSPAAGGSIAPTSATVNDGATTTFNVAANSGYHVDTVTGCGGSFDSGSGVYTTGPITADCTVTANFAADTGGSNLVCSAPLNHPIATDIDGTSINFSTGAIVDDGPSSGYDFNPYGLSSGKLAFYWGQSTIGAGVADAATGTGWKVLHSGDTVGSSSLFSRSTGAATVWDAGADGYLGVKFNCSSIPNAPASGVCYGYVHMTSTGPDGFPASIVDYCYDKTGADVTIGGGTTTPTAAVSPNPMTFSVVAGQNATNTLTIANTGGGSLDWAITEAASAVAHVSKAISSVPKAAHSILTQGSRFGGGLKPTQPRANPLPQAIAVDEGFDDITTLSSAGWLMINKSSTTGAQPTWFQGNPADPDDPTNGVFNSYDGDPDAYIAANFQNVGSGANQTISNWLLSPPINFSDGASVSFYTRSLFAPDDQGNPTTTVYPDRLEVRLCVNVGDCSNVGTGTGSGGATGTGDFGTLLLSINPNLTTNDDPTGANGYPLSDWAHFTINSGLPTSGTGRIAFRYFVTSGGPSGNNSNYIGIDRVTINDGGSPATGCSNPSNVPWLSESATSGSVAGGSQQTTDVTVDASSLAAGSYSAHICVATNDTANPMVDVPVNVTVTAGGGTTHTVSTSAVPSAGGSIAPTSATVNDGDTTTFTVTANSGYHVDSVTGCGGSFDGGSGVYTTGPITADCTVVANFAADGSGGGEVLVVDLSVENQITITAGTGVSEATASGSTTTGFLLADFFASAGTQAIGTTTYAGTPTLAPASVASNGTPKLFRSGDTDSGLNIYSYSATTTTTFTAGQVAFAGSATWVVSPALYTAMLTAPATGNVYFPADDSGDIATATLIGTYRIGGSGSGNPPSITKSFSPDFVAPSASSTATIRITNPNGGPATLTADLVDTLPSGLVASSASTTCTGSVSFTSGSITLASGASIPSGSCTITASVSSATEGSYTNTIAAGALQTDQGNNADPASATLTVSNELPFPAPYCSVSFPSNVEPISRVVLTGIDNPSNPAVNGSPALENFLSVAGGALSQGGVYSAAVEGNTDGPYTTKIRVYIDWNQNGTFDSNEGYSLSDLVDSTGTDGKQSTGDITVPADAVLGSTRMRVIKKFSTVPDACNTDGYGQAEDYTVVVDNNPLPQPSANVTPSAFAMTAEEGASATDTMVVENSGPGRLTFNVKRALPEGVNFPYGSNAGSASKRVSPSSEEIRRNDAIKAALSGLPMLYPQDDLVGAAARGEAKINVGHTVLANDPLCEVGTPGLVVHDGNGAPDNGYGWNTIAGTDPKYVDKFTPDTYPATYTTVCATFLTNAGRTSAPVQVVVFADDGPGGTPGTELGRVAVTANNISSALSQSFQAFDISDMGLNITEGSVYIGFEWDATTVTGLYVGADESSAVSAGGYMYSSGTWSPISDPDTGFEGYKALFVRAIEESTGEPGVGCDNPSNISWLSATPASGTINGVGTMDITIKANAASLTAGTYSALLCVNTNDAAHPQFEIPVTFTVTPNVGDDTIFKDGFDGESTPPIDQDVYDSGEINLDVPNNFDGVYLNWVDGSHCTDGSCGGNLNLYALDTDGTIHFYWPNNAAGTEGGVGTASGTTGTYTVLASGATVGPSSNFIVIGGNADTSNWAAGVDGYLGFRFGCSGSSSGICYGYANIKTTAPMGFPATVVHYWYNKVGAPITIP